MRNAAGYCNRVEKISCTQAAHCKNATLDSPVSPVRGPSTMPRRSPRRCPYAPLHRRGGSPPARRGGPRGTVSVGKLEEAGHLDRGLEGPVGPSRERWVGTLAE